MNERDAQLLALLEQLQALSPAEAETAARLSLRSATGQFLGEALLSDKAVQALTDSTTSLNSYLASQPDTPDDPNAIDPFLEAEFEAHCIALPVDDLFKLAVDDKDPEKAVAEFDEMTREYEEGEL
ncbi:hypothetical protein ACIBCO_37350 [Streptomyces violascens]|uniref:hypothetical protein n=1 Tax=Streptomyces violascens TaxID=67381 RepID=UPI00379AA327